jgi:predicted transcriptional regulator
MAAAKSVTITTRVPASLAKKLGLYAKAARRTRSWVVGDILDRYVDGEIAFVKAVQEGVDAADRGETIPHDEAMRRLDAYIAKRKRERQKAA